MSFAEFMELALYDPVVGYYRQVRRRIGYGAGTDFFTASTSAPVFGELVAAAATTLLTGRNPRDFVFVELGVEPEGGVLKDVNHPFAGIRQVAVGNELGLDGNCVVFSNELFDAQPFRRFQRQGSSWVELGVAVQQDELVYVLTADDVPSFLPHTAPDGYLIDAPIAARGLIERIAAASWRGLFLAFDYGKSWPELAESTPTGTARAYYRHAQSNDLLARPGEQDLTCHVCWDWLAASLEQAGFSSPQVQSQEAFLVKNAATFIEQTSRAEAPRLSPKKLALMQLLHPSHLGQKFQVLSSRRF
jgi:SAM-dependent MidA family methyltransferase